MKARNEKGFSLVELLVAMAIASVLGVAGVALFASSNWTYKVNEDVSEAQQNVRVAMEAISKDIRTAGFGLDDPPVQLNFDGNLFTSPITATNSSTGPDTITILGIGHEAGILMQSGDAACNGNGDSYICLCRDQSACPNDYEDPENFFSSTGTYQSVRRYVSINGITSLELSTTADDHTRSTGTAPTKMKISSTTLDRDFPDGTPVYIIQAVTYSVATDLTGCSTEHPCLASADYTMLRGGSTPGARQVIAENIEDIQFAYGIDVNPRDGKIDDSNSDSSFTTADFVNDPTDDTSIVAVRANVVSKTATKDIKGGTFTRPAVEDRAAGSPEGYRKRLLTKIIKLRNSRSGGS